jgi:hypothetical protein
VKLLCDGQEVAEQARLEVDRARLSLARDTGLGQKPPAGLSVCRQRKFRHQEAGHGDEHHHGHEC